MMSKKYIIYHKSGYPYHFFQNHDSIGDWVCDMKEATKFTSMKQALSWVIKSNGEEIITIEEAQVISIMET